MAVPTPTNESPASEALLQPNVFHPNLNSSIRIVGAKTHNLKNVTIAIPRDQLVVITGRSGSGKSSLAIDTIFAEGQRQYIESLSIYSRQFFKQLPTADVDLIEGLPPTICLDQNRGAANRRSTVGTLAEIYDYLRLLMARVGTIRCFQCQQPITQHTPHQICELLMEMPERTKIMVLAPLTNRSSGDHAATIKTIRRERLVRMRVDGEIYDIEQSPTLNSADRHSIAAVTDRIIIREEVEKRLIEAIEFASRMSNGRVLICSQSPANRDGPWLEAAFSTRYACPQCEIEYAEIQPRSFSFNSPFGACERCVGLGWIENHLNTSDDRNFANIEKSEDDDSGEDGNNTNSDGSEMACPACHGSRVSKQARSIFLANKHIGEMVELSIDESIPFFESLDLPAELALIANPIVNEILHRLKFLKLVGVGYLSIGRGVNTLSGGEHQRVRLATSIGSGLTNIGYILDEPSIGLHQRDNDRLIEAIRNLQRRGNSVLLVEHDEATIRAADFVIDMGPGAGEQGGHVVATGTPEELSANPASLTGAYLAGRRGVYTSKDRRTLSLQRAIGIVGASGRNLKSIDVQIPLGGLVCISGVSGSGKSTLINQTLVPAIWESIENDPARRTGRIVTPPQPFKKLTGIELIARLIVVDQKPIGTSARGCPATVTGILDDLRKIFAATKRAKQLGFGAARFSFNSKTGWCPDCRGLGVKKIEMNFMPDFHIVCETCRGRRFNLQTMSVKFNSQSIADVLAMSVMRAREFFDGFEKIKRPLQSLIEVGLGYLKLGQSTTTLSGGEAQRLKLATELAKPDLGHTLYVLDEPTTGLHFEDIRVLLSALNCLIDKGNSMIVIEHNLDVIRSSDWVIDLGPEGGTGGGELLAAGTPEEVSRVATSHTGRYLQQLFHVLGNAK